MLRVWALFVFGSWCCASVCCILLLLALSFVHRFWPLFSDGFTLDIKSKQNNSPKPLKRACFKVPGAPQATKCIYVYMYRHISIYTHTHMSSVHTLRVQDLALSLVLPWLALFVRKPRFELLENAQTAREYTIHNTSHVYVYLHTIYIK